MPCYGLWERLHLGKLPQSLSHALDGRGFHVGCADGTVWFVTADVPLSEIEKLCTIEGANKYGREKSWALSVEVKY
jgi:hypothetical protein